MIARSIIETLDSKLYPNLSKIQEKDPQWLVEMLRPMMEKQKITFMQACTIMEADLKSQDYYEGVEK